MADRIGIFGGTFDPPHLGHMILASEALYQLNLDKVLFMLSPDPPHKRNLEKSDTPRSFDNAPKNDCQRCQFRYHHRRYRSPWPTLYSGFHAFVASSTSARHLGLSSWEQIRFKVSIKFGIKRMNL